MTEGPGIFRAGGFRRGMAGGGAFSVRPSDPQRDQVR